MSTFQPKFLPIQLIYSGGTDNRKGNSLADSMLPVVSIIESIAIDYLKKITFPCLGKKGKGLKLESNAEALLIFDVFKGQHQNEIISFS